MRPPRRPPWRARPDCGGADEPGPAPARPGALVLSAWMDFTPGESLYYAKPLSALWRGWAGVFPGAGLSGAGPRLRPGARSARRLRGLWRFTTRGIPPRSAQVPRRCQSRRARPGPPRRRTSAHAATCRTSSGAAAILVAQTLSVCSARTRGFRRRRRRQQLPRPRRPQQRKPADVALQSGARAAIGMTVLQSTPSPKGAAYAHCSPAVGAIHDRT